MRLYEILNACYQTLISPLSSLQNTYTRAIALVTGPKILRSPASNAPLESRFNLTASTSSTYTLPDGRTLGYATYGAPIGRPILYLHGIPGSRLEAAAFDDVATHLDARIISVDRPGIGWSSPHPNRTLLDHARDVEALAEYLELEEYGVWGISGGGPYALACAYSLPRDKLKAVSIMCGLGPPHISKSGMNWPNYLGFAFVHKHAPWFARWYIQHDITARLDLSDEERLLGLKKQVARGGHVKDRELFAGDDAWLRLTVRNARECFGGGSGAFSQDASVMSREWGFRLEDIRRDLPVGLWYGKQDTNVPAVQGKEIAKALGGKAALRVEEETHSTLVVGWSQEALEKLLESM